MLHHFVNTNILKSIRLKLLNHSKKWRTIIVIRRTKFKGIFKGFVVWVDEGELWSLPATAPFIHCQLFPNTNPIISLALQIMYYIMKVLIFFIISRSVLFANNKVKKLKYTNYQRKRIIKFHSTDFFTILYHEDVRNKISKSSLGWQIWSSVEVKSQDPFIFLTQHQNRIRSYPNQISSTSLIRRVDFLIKLVLPADPM